MKRIGVASQDRRTVTSHAGRCRHYWIYEVQENGVLRRDSLELPEELIFHNAHGVEEHPLYAVEAVLAGGMGRGLFTRLSTRGIRAVVTGETDPDRAVAAYLDGTLEELPPHDHHHGHGRHPHDHGHGDVHPAREPGDRRHDDGLRGRP